jgi:hypothetical protein
MVEANTTGPEASFVVKAGRATRLDVVAGAITIGTRVGCDLVLKDPVAAAAHCRVRCAGESFTLEDLGSATGTFVNGIPARGATALGDGDEVVLGVTRLTASLGRNNGRPSLTFELKANGFWYVPSGKAAPQDAGKFRTDPDRWVYTEVGLGRYPALRFGNWLAVLVGLAFVGLLFVPKFEEPLLDPGRLCMSHAQLFAAVRPEAVPENEHELAKREGCKVCHDPFADTPMAKCGACHGDLMLEQHPFQKEPMANVDPVKLRRALNDEDCAGCHRDHRGSDSRQAEFLPTMAQTEASCDGCHGGTDLATGGFVPSRPPAKVKRDETPRVHSAFAFGHDDHVTVLHTETQEPMRCNFCHQEHPGARQDAEARVVEADRRRRDYLTIPFETCARCHVQRRGSDGKLVDERSADWKGWWPRKPDEKTGALASLWTVNWHGSEEATKDVAVKTTCANCHQEVFQGPRRMVKRLEVTPSQYSGIKARYALDRRSHGAQFVEQHAKGEACTACHRREDLVSLRKVEAVFWHALHVDAPAGLLAPADKRSLSDACLKCHSDRSESAGLKDHASGLFNWAPDSCSETCHVEEETAGGPKKPLRPQPSPPARQDVESVITFEDFPHKYHLDFQHEALKDGCFTCHSFEAVPGAAGFQLVPRTIPKMRECQACHSMHKNVAGGACEKCHPMEFGQAAKYHDFLGKSPPPSRPFLTKPWPEASNFNHFSVGHDKQPCAECHQVKQGPNEFDLAQATSLQVVPIPDESNQACRDCHLKRKQRFHWR